MNPNLNYLDQKIQCVQRIVKDCEQKNHLNHMVNHRSAKVMIRGNFEIGKLNNLVHVELSMDEKKIPCTSVHHAVPTRKNCVLNTKVVQNGNTR